MPRTVKDLRDAAEQRYASGDLVGALKGYRLVLEAVPLDFDTRMRIADCLLALGERRLAAAVYAAAAIYDLKAGVPLRALVAIKTIAPFYPQVEGLLRDLAALYSKDSPRVGRGARAAPADLGAQIRDDVTVDYEIDRAALLQTTAQMAAYTGNIENFPPKVPPIPIFSDLAADAFERVLHALHLRRLKHDDVVIREGEPGRSFFVVARGTVRVFRHSATGQRVDLAMLGEGSVFGEMALVRDEPRTASVDVEGNADLLEFDRAALLAIADQMESLATALEKFTRERLLRNLLATNPIFRPFDRERRLDLLNRFTVHPVPGGTQIVRQGEEGRGIYLVLSGAVDVTTAGSDGSAVKVAALGPGECFGEISLVQQRPTTATVVAARKSTILFLARELFQRLLEAVPELRDYFVELSEQRLMDMRLSLDRVEGEEVVVDDDLIMI